ncbi:hypothetical protein ECMP0209401_1723 [Escherichia coli MP020940.1]|nr:hypothetical protein EC2785200_1677 [Escherichia coli 2785200]EMW42798.1 hypothetical protein EC2788150_1297 [Escherichia coli 2788150]EMX52544.1 hypothetical protein ECMP0209802_1747 [Escherichia coli MP020980.2]EMX58316.1 hypothetical protein ECMP0209401_1723 [Escherichia coli MP020940.1]EMZ98337.1 hypothetical protein ECP03048161_1410 [Escherichia coli P0304816.1]ENF25269.1 hypothetical protein ECP030481610_1549 [Escherichia coli P0304816.10]ENF27186.1 hypothetical protein ECP030481612_
MQTMTSRSRQAAYSIPEISAVAVGTPHNDRENKTNKEK